MVSVSPAHRERIDGLAVFAAAAFALGLGLIFVLERVGAPDALVEALGPFLALAGLCVIGAMTQAPNLTDFMAARRAVPAIYGGLAFAATAGGLAAALLAESDYPPPWQGVVIGLIGAALIVAPRWRRENASAISDVLATRFPAAPMRIFFFLMLVAMGALTAIAGFDLATHTLVASLGASRRVAEALVILALVATLVPGGLKGLLWSDAASGGGAFLIAAIGAGLAVWKTPEPFAPLAMGWRAAVAAPGADASSLQLQIAAALAVAFFFALAPPAIGSASGTIARRAGLAGLAFALIGVAMVAVALPFFIANAETSRTAKAFATAAAWLPALALARAGAFGAARASGLDLASAYSRLTVLSSRRIALIRARALIVIGLCPLAPSVPGFDAGHALYFALAIGLAFVAPSLALSLALPASSQSSVAALAVSLAVAAARLRLLDAMPSSPDLLIEGLIAGGAGFVVGAAATLIFPDRRKRATGPLSDPFVDVPLDLLE
jgi:cation/acetate symporter